MGWSIDEVRRRREQLNAGNAKQTTSSAGGATSAAARNVLKKNPYKDTAAAHTTAKTPTTAVQKTTGSTSGTAATRNVLEKDPYPGTGTTRAIGGTGTGLTPAQVAQKRAQLTAGTTTGRLPTSVTTTQQPERTNGTRKVLGTVTADELGKTMLAYVSTPTGSPVKTDRQEDYEPDWNYAGNDNTPKERAIAQGTYGSYVKAAQAAGKALSQDRQTDRFDELNQWMDESPRHRQLVSLMRQGKSGTEDAMALGSSTGDNAAAVREEYSPGELLKMGYTAEEINGARRYIREYDALPLKDRAARRTADTIKGIGATVAAAVPLTGEYAGQSAQNIYTTWQNETALDKELEGDARGKELKQLMTAVDMDYKPQYTDAQLREMGYSAQEISTMRARINGTVANEAVDKDMSLGYQLYHYGQQRTSAAQAGMNPTAQAAMGIAASAAENLAVAGVSPYLVLPVLSAQGAAESMGQSMEQGDSAGTALATGLAKFGAGWAINSVGAADLAKTMGADYAKETVAGRIADFVRGLSGSSEFAKAYPVVANAISGGIDNAMQAFVETYADTAIDAVLGGDQESAEALLKPETFLQAVQSGLTGGASGALGGAVGTGLGKMNAVLEERSGPTRQERAKQAQELAERMLEPGEMEQQASPAEERQEAAPAAQTEQPGETVRAAEQPAVQAVQSDNAAVQRYAAAVQADSLTNKTLDLFTPKAANAENRAALAEAYGVELPATASETRRMLRQLAQEQRTAAEAETGELAQTAEPMQTEPAAQVEAPAADPGQSTVEKAGETVESGQGYSVSMSNDTMTVRFADGTEAVRKIDPENPRTMLFDPEQLHRQAQAESRAEAPQEIPAVQQTEARADGMRETLGMNRQTLNQKQYSVQKELERWKVSRGASETISRMVPDSISDLSRYTTAASSLYRMGQMEGVKSFDQALKLAGGMNNLAPNTNYVLQQPGGRVALEAAWTQGRGELEAGTRNKGMLGGALSEKSTKGEGRVFWRNSARAENRVGTQLIALNARGTGTDAILKSVLRGPDGAPSTRVKAYVETETGRIFFGDAVDDVFGTILHEDLHWYNALDQEGAAGFQDQTLEYLANGLGFENVDEMIRGKLNDYAAQGLTYNQAAEELIADAVGGIFTTPEDVTRFAEFQRAQAEKNEGKAGTIHKVMNAVKEMLNQIIGKAKEVLTLDPENKAALKAQRLAEAEKKALQDAYFAHAEKAMDNLRAAKENAAALKSEGAAQGVRYSLPDMAKETETEKTKRQMGLTIRPAEQNAERTAKVSGQEWSNRKTQDVYKAIRSVLNEFGIPNKTFRMEDVDVEFGYGSKNIQESANKQRELTSREYNDFALVQANIEEVLANAVPLEAHADKKGKPHVDGMIVLASALQDGERIIPVRAELKLYDNRPTALYFAIAETTAKNSREAANKKRTGSEMEESVLKDTRQPSTGSIEETGSEDGGNASVEAHPTGSSDINILDYYRLVNHDANFTKYFSDEVAQKAERLEGLHTEQQQITEERRALRAERSTWLDSAEVKQIEVKKKALGNFSAEARAYRDSEEYQGYLAKRKEYNSRLAALEERDSALTEQMKTAKERLQQRKDAQNKDAQNAYNARAKACGGNAEYRRVLAKEQFGVTEEFRRAGYILPDGQMLDFAQNDRSRDTDHREILEVFGPAEVKNGTEALNEFLLDGNVRVMAEAPGVDISADTAPTAQQLEQIRKMAEQLGGERRQFTLDISTADGRVAASKEYSGRVDADKVVREIREYYKTGELPQESSLAKFRYQLAEQANRDARKDDQRQASRAIADTAAALDTLSEFFGVTRGVKLSQDSLDGLAARWTKANGSRADRAKLTNEARVLAEYLTADGADMSKAQSLAETLAGEVLDGATYRDSELWDEYPDLHKLEYTVNKNGSAKAELVKAYGSWSEAVAEARRHGVTLRQAEGVRDGNPAEQYESVINDTRAVGGIRDGEKAIWKAAAQQAGVDGAQSMESTEWLDVLMNLHDAIKPKMMSRFADDAEYEDARVELAGRMIGDVMNAPEMTDAEAIFEGMQRQGLQMARAAAGTEAGADEVSQGLKAVQKAQRQEFRRRLAANQRAGARDTAVQIDGRTFTNMGDLNEYITYQREEFQRQLKQQAKRLKAERQEALDEAKLFYHERMGEMREENDYLADQVKQEQRRADRAERSLIIQENEIMEWEAENERRREAWQQKQAQRNAIAIETARQQRDEDIAIAKRVAERRVQKARDARKIDEMRRSIRQNSAQLNQMLLRHSKDKYVQRGLIVQAAEVAKLADQVILNQKAVNQLTALEDSIRLAAGSESAPNAMTEDWKQSGVEDMIKALRDDLTASRQARLTKLQEQLAEAEALPDSEKARMLQDRLRQRIRETENRTYLPLTVDQMRLLKTITSSTLHVVRTANKTLSLAKAEEVDAIAQTAAREVLNSKGNRPGGSFDGVRNALTKYQLDMLGGERVFRMLGGYAKDGQMEKLARMLNDGQRKQTKITLEGERLFDNVTGKTHRKEMNTFAGPGAEMVDIGLTDTKGNAVPLTHAMLCSLYMHLQNQDSREHLLTGGLTVPNMKQYAKGNIERAYQEGQTVQIGMLKDADGMPMTETILEKVENALTEYDRAWIADMKDFFGRYTTNLINETSMQLLGYNRAEVKNYYPIAVDKSELATQIEGLNLDATIEGRGFLKNRVKSSKAIMLEECSSVVQRSLRDTAAYAGLALPIRDVQKVLNSTVETEQGIGNLKNGILKEQWGQRAVGYIDELLTDLQTKQRRRPSTADKIVDRLRGNYAGAILTLNPGVAIAQAASLPTAGAVLGADTMAAVVPFVKNLSAKQRTALETEIREHGDVLLDWRKRGSQQDELSDIGKDPTLAEKAMDKLPKVLTGWINGMDEVTVAALWEGSKAYVKNHADEFAAGAAKEGSEDYWQAVNQTYQKVIEQTQPNYTTMQRAGIQRNPNEVLKQLTMFTTQRFQNYGILADAVMDYNAQKARYEAGETEETRAELQRAGKQLQRAAVSQVAQTAVFALMKIGADFLLHRWDREQDENGDVTWKSLLDRFTGLFAQSAAGNFLYGGEVYSLVDNALHGKNYDVLSAASITVINNLAGDITKFVAELRKDTSDMDETKLAAHHGKVEKYALTLMEDGMEIAGVPFGNGRKIVEAFKGYVQDIENAANGKAFRFSSLPASATGQYDRLYNAYRNGDTAEAKAAMEKLDGMGKADEVYKQLKARLVKYDETVQKAAQAQVNGSDAQREQLTRQVIRELYDVLGIRTGVKADADKREAVIDCVTGAVSSKANELLKNGNSSATDDLVEALDSGRAQDVQEELDRLLRAGKSVTSLKSKITEVCKPDYLAGSGYDREQMAEMLLRLTDADGKALYEQKTLDGWVKQAEKAEAAAEDTADPYADLR